MARQVHFWVLEIIRSSVSDALEFRALRLLASGGVYPYMINGKILSSSSSPISTLLPTSTLFLFSMITLMNEVDSSR